MKIIRSITGMRKVIEKTRQQGLSIGFVPTMGCLHEGHLSLVRASISDCDTSVVSIFVNPAQFGPGEDLEKYPRDIEGDAAALEKEGVDFLFLPEGEDMYPEGYSTFVEVTSKCVGTLCGASRPGHFRGVATVVTKLFNIVDPDKSYFGQKDVQQVFVIKRMVLDLNLRTVVKVLPTVRESDGLAMSSRNRYLSKDERVQAGLLFKALCRAKSAVEGGEKNSGAVISAAKEILSSSQGIRTDYLEVLDPSSMEPVTEIHSDVLIAAAVLVGSTRLIDNVTATPNQGKTA